MPPGSRLDMASGRTFFTTLSGRFLGIVVILSACGRCSPIVAANCGYPQTETLRKQSSEGDGHATRICEVSVKPVV